MKFVLSLFVLLNAAQAMELAVDPDGCVSVDRSIVEPGRTIQEFLPRALDTLLRYDVEPGLLPEGDYQHEAAFTLDGELVLVTNRYTDNVTVMDWSTMEVVTNVDVGYFPAGIAVSDDYAVVSLAFSDSVKVIDLDTYAVVAGFPTGEQPWVVRISPDGSRAYVSCDIDDVCEVIDLTSLTHLMTIPDFPIGLLTYTWTSENARWSAQFSNFEVTPDGAHLVTGDGDSSVIFVNTSTGAVDYEVTGIENCWTVGLSGDGSTVVAVTYGPPPVAYQIDVATHAITNSVPITGYSLMTFEVGVNADGSKAFLGISDNSSCIVRFASSDFVVFTGTYTPFTIGTSPDHSLALGIQYRFSVVDFASESVLGQYSGNSLDVAGVSPVGSRVAALYPVLSEEIFFYDYSTPASPAYRGKTFCGLDPEGDAPRRVAVAPDGSVAVVADVLSDNASIVDLSTLTVDTILDMGDRVQNVAITSDSHWAVVCCFNTNSVKIVDLSTNTVAADVPTGSRAGIVSLSPDDSYAYVGNISSNSVSVVALDGASSYEVTEIPCGTIGVVWAAYGVSSDVECSPTGEYVLVAASFIDQVKVIDTGTNSVVASLPVGDFPIQIAFEGTGEYAVVTNAFSDSYSLIHVDGASSSVVGTFGTADYPLRVAYDPVNDRFGIGHYSAKTVGYVDPTTGASLGSDSYAAYGSLFQVDFDAAGEPIVLTGSDGTNPGHLHLSGTAHVLPAGPTFFDHNGSLAVTAVAMPGPDVVSVFKSTTCGDANGDGMLTPADGYVILNYLGTGPEPSSCWAANVNGDSGLTPADGYQLLNYLGAGPAIDCAPCEL
jgi:YVTN family beta-propeller protein